jgi:hypothetical protein
LVSSLILSLSWYTGHTILAGKEEENEEEEEELKTWIDVDTEKRGQGLE